MNSVDKILAGFNPGTQLISRFAGSELSDFIIGTDLDHSFIPWGENAYRNKEKVNKCLQSNHQAFEEVKGRAVVAGLTGIDYDSVLEINDLLPMLDILATNNGLEVRVNNNSEPSKKWLAKNRKLNANPDWESFIKNKGGWDKNLFIKALNIALNNLGYVVEITDESHRPKIAYPHHAVRKSYYNNETVMYSSGESAVYLLKEADGSSSDYKLSGETLAMRVIGTYNEISRGHKVQFKISEHDTYFYIFFSPSNEITINKASAFEASLHFLSEEIKDRIKFGIGIGDSDNDGCLGKLTEITLPSKIPKMIPFYFIVSGRNSSLLQDPKIKHHPRLFIAEKEGDIGPKFREAVIRANRETS